MAIRIDDGLGDVTVLPGAGILQGYSPGAYGQTVPVDGTAGFAHGAIFHRTSGTGSTDALYVNNGSVASSSFKSLIAGVATSTGISATNLTLNGTNDITIQLNAITALKIDDAVVGPVAATDTAGKSVYIASQSGGTFSSSGGAGGSISVTAGYGSGTSMGGSISLTAGAGGADGGGDSTNEVGGSITLTAGATGADGIRNGAIRLISAAATGPVVFTTAPAPAAKSSTSVTLAAADLFTGLVTSTQAGAVTATLDTGANMDLSMPNGTGTNEGFEWSLINLGSSSGAATVTASTGHTVVGLTVVSITTSGRFLTKRTATSTWITYRLS